MLREEELAGAILVVLANKQDMEGCMSVAEVHQALGLEALKNRTFQVSQGEFALECHHNSSYFSPRYSKHQRRKAKDWIRQWTGYRMPCRRERSATKGGRL